ncbi:MAG: hypothetical protein PHX20_00255 [Candidatus Omnitrophica bacterium]|nr:hypothetical protein [Candidatus Omnitrophota bacterium]MDD5435967.1 hypothetical protein [Candidatus Omnitrophota bacterium]
MKNKMIWIMVIAIAVCFVSSNSIVFGQEEALNALGKGIAAAAEQNKIKANEQSAIVNIKLIIGAIDLYQIDNDKYPLSDSDLTPYLNTSYNGKEMVGYRYSIEYKSDGYKVIATPVERGKTGNKIFTAENGKSISETQ